MRGVCRCSRSYLTRHPCPSSGPASSTSGTRPSRFKAAAIARPAGPPPTTTASLRSAFTRDVLPASPQRGRAELVEGAAALLLREEPEEEDREDGEEHERLLGGHRRAGDLLIRQRGDTPGGRG